MVVDRGVLTHWYVYILILEDQKVYVGITTDVGRRFYQHQTGDGPPIDDIGVFALKKTTPKHKLWR